MTTSKLTIIRVNFTAFLIKLKDDLTEQAILLTPAEVIDLRDQLNQMDLDSENDEANNHYAAIQKALTIYNGHSLPIVDREQFEQDSNVGPHRFDFEITQRMKDDSGVVVETEVVGVI